MSLSILSSAFLWLICIELLSLAAVPFLGRSFPKEITSALARPTALFVFTTVCALVFRFEILPTGADSTRLIALGWVLLGIGFAVWRRQNALAGLWSRSTLPLNLLYLVLVLVGLFVSGSAPALDYSERPMDMSFITYFIRGGSIPPEDPWAAGMQTRYYYLGYLMVALVHQLSGVSPLFGFHFAHASVLALLLPILAAIFVVICNLSLSKSIAAALLCFLSVSYESIYLAVFEPERSPFSAYMALSRILPDRVVTETPLWGYLYGDLHPYIIAQPFECLTLFFTASYVLLPRSRLICSAFLGVLLGMMPVLHSWSFLVLGLVGAVLLVCYLAAKVWAKDFPLVDEVMSVVPFPLLFLPLLFVFLGDVSTGSGSIQFVGSNNTPHSFEILFRTFGYLYSPLFVFGVFALVLSANSHRPTGTESGSILNLPDTYMLLGAFTVSALVMLGVWESLWIVNRSAFVARTLNVVHYITSIAAIAFALIALRAVTKPIARSSLLFFIWLFSIGTMLNGGYAAYLAFHNPLYRSKFSFFAPGDIYLKNNDDRGIVHYIRSRPDLNGPLIESIGKPYSLAARVGSLTGIPTFLGWEGHLKLRGISKADIKKRQLIVDNFYSTVDPSEAFKIARKHGIELVVVGGTEKERYSPEGLEKLENSPKLFELLKSTGGSALYRVAEG